MKNNLSVLVTGASSGIGKACALLLDKSGFKVYAGIRNIHDGEVLVKEGSGNIKPVILDVTEENTINETFRIISENTDWKFYGLVNNAGIGISGVIEATPVEEFRKVMEVNVIGLHAVTKTFLPLLRKNKGRIVNIGSASSFFAAPGQGPYAASKFAVRAITDALRAELIPSGMHVSLIAPGPIESDIWEKNENYRKKLRDNATPELRETYKIFIQCGDKIAKEVKPHPASEVAKAVVKALSDKKPKYTYLVTSEAKKALFLAKLPKQWVNWGMMREMRLKVEG